jgi:hypothetical protein
MMLLLPTVEMYKPGDEQAAFIFYDFCASYYLKITPKFAIFRVGKLLFCSLSCLQCLAYMTLIIS